MTTEYAEGSTFEVAQFAAGIETASGGTITAGFTFGITSKIADQTADYELSHRYGTGIDLDCRNADPDAVYAWAASLDSVVEAVLLEDQVHLTLRPGATVDLSGCPKPKKKKAAEPVEEPAPE